MLLLYESPRVPLALSRKPFACWSLSVFTGSKPFRIAGIPCVAAKDAFAAEDYDAAMKTGVVLRKHRSIRDGKDSRVVIEYEINTALIECLNSVEKRAAIETGQEVDRQDIKLRGGMNDQAEVLKRTFTFEELNQMQLRMQATIEAERSGKVVEAKAIPEDTHTSGEREGDVTPSQAPTASRSWRD